MARDVEVISHRRASEIQRNQSRKRKRKEHRIKKGNESKHASIQHFPPARKLIRNLLVAFKISATIYLYLQAAGYVKQPSLGSCLSVFEALQFGLLSFVQMTEYVFCL